MKYLVLLLSVCLIAGCSTVGLKKSAAAGKIGCLDDEMELTENNWTTYVVTCKGKEFVCSNAGENQLNCTERLK